MLKLYPTKSLKLINNNNHVQFERIHFDFNKKSMKIKIVEKKAKNFGESSWANYGFFVLIFNCSFSSINNHIKWYSFFILKISVNQKKDTWIEFHNSKKKKNSFNVHILCQLGLLDDPIQLIHNS
jgi:hypothetical protein